MKRCDWAGNEPLMQNYHDKEWGIPVHDDKVLFEFLILEGAQAGLSWQTILRRRENYRKALDGFNPEKIAKYGKAKVDLLLKNEGIIRNRLKIKATVINAQKFLDVKKEFGSFDKYVWRFVNYKQKKNRPKSINQVPAASNESDGMSKDLKKRGFKFVGSVICYAFMQATGMVDDHTIGCFRCKK